MDAEGVYQGLEFPDAPADRPYVFINMVATIDGKTVTGSREESIPDLGSAVDHATMRQIENVADGVMIGAQNLRATPKMWYPSHLYRFVVTRSGNVPPANRFFTDAPGRAFVVCAGAYRDACPPGLSVLALGEDTVDWARLLKYLRNNMGIKRLLVEGGSELNAELFHAELIDEIFLTVAPKVKCGREVPTVAGGQPLKREDIQNFDLVSTLTSGNEVFLRYRRR